MAVVLIMTFKLLLSAPSAVLKTHPAPSRPIISTVLILCARRYFNNSELEKALPRYLSKTMSPFLIRFSTNSACLVPSKTRIGDNLQKKLFFKRVRT